MKRRISPSRPMTILDGSSSGEQSIGSGGVRTVTSTVTPSSSDARRSGNLGSWHADCAAEAIALPRGITGIGIPMHPRSSLPG